MRKAGRGRLWPNRVWPKPSLAKPRPNRVWPNQCGTALPPPTSTCPPTCPKPRLVDKCQSQTCFCAVLFCVVLHCGCGCCYVVCWSGFSWVRPRFGWSPRPLPLTRTPLQRTSLCRTAQNFALGAARVSHDSPRTPNVRISVPRRFKHHQNSTRRHPERHKKSEMVAGEGKKKARNFGPSTLPGPRPSGPPPFAPTVRGSADT